VQENQSVEKPVALKLSKLRLDRPLLIDIGKKESKNDSTLRVHVLRVHVLRVQVLRRQVMT
jgi:hypothetical protein